MVSVTSSAVATAASLATAAWLNGKYQIVRDVKLILDAKRVEKGLQAVVEANRLSPWYAFEEQVEIQPAHHEALWSRERSYSYRECYAQACRYAQFLIAAGWKPGELVGFYLQNSADYIVLTLATWALGTAPALLNFNLGKDALVHCIRTASPSIIITDAETEVKARMEEVRNRVEGELGARIIVWDEHVRQKADALNPLRPGDEYRVNVRPGDPSLLLYTSGTTGLPKAAAFSVDRLWTTFTDLSRLEVYPGPNGSRWYCCMPLYHGTGIVTALTTIRRGVTTCVGKKFSTSRFWDEVRACKATVITYVGETARYLLAAPASTQDRVHNVIIMYGNGLRPDVWQRFTDRFGIQVVVEFFSSTEGVFNLLNVTKNDWLATSVGHHGLIMRTWLHNTYVPIKIDYTTNEPIRDAKTGFAQRQPYSVGGEMVVAVPEKNAFIGYWKNPNATDKKFLHDLFKKGDLYYRSGDALRRDDEGRWFFMDRLGDTYRWKSENVSTAEVAQVIGDFPGIDEANVYGVTVPHHEGRAGCAAIYLSSSTHSAFSSTTSTSSASGPSASVSSQSDIGLAHFEEWTAQLLVHMRARLPRYAIPLFLRILDGPVEANTHNNKQNKVPLRNEGIDLQKVAQGERAGRDVFLWLPALTPSSPSSSSSSSSSVSSADRYKVFTSRAWNEVNSGRVRL